MKRRVSLGITDETNRQLEDLMKWLGATRAEVLLYAIERLHREVESRGVQDEDHTRPRLPHHQHINEMP
jgi:predicted DNA-binding protein